MVISNFSASARFLAAGGFVLGDAVLALLGQLLDDGDDGVVVEFDALIDFLLLDGGKQQADGARQFFGFLGLHGRLHVFGDAGFEAHGRFLQKLIRRKKDKKPPAFEGGRLRCATKNYD
jgi:hypothetical protein